MIVFIAHMLIKEVNTIGNDASKHDINFSKNKNLNQVMMTCLRCRFQMSEYRYL